MNISQGPHYIDDTLTFSVTTHRFDTGALTDADAVPTYRVYEDETGTAILTGSMAKLDDANTTGFYSEQVTLSAANGFEAGKSYNVYVSAAVNSVTGAASGAFRMSGVHPANVTQFGGSALTSAAGIPEVKVASIAASAITAAAIASDAITDAKVAADVTIASVTGAVGSVTGAVGSVTGNVGGNVTGSVGSVASGGITAASIAADAFTAAKFAADVTTEFQSGLATAAALTTIDDFLDTEIAAIKAKTDNLPSDPADASDIAASFVTVNTKLDTIDDLVDTEVAAIKAVTDKIDTALELDGSVYRYTTNALEQAPSGGGGGVADWTADEKTAIRSILGIPGSGTTPADPSTGILDTIRDAVPTSAAIASQVRTELTTELARVDVAVSTRASQTSVDDLPTNTELATALSAADDSVLAAIAALNNLSSAGAQAAAAAALAAYGAATGTNVSAVQTAVLAKLPAALSAGGNIKADMEEINEVAITGAGTSGNKWRPA